MKIAICFSGHLRNFKDLLNNFKEKILLFREENQVDIFFSIWDTYEPEYSWSNQENKISNYINTEEILQINPIKIEIENFNSIKNQFLLKNFTNIECTNPQIIKDGVLHSTPMFYKIYKANKLKKEHEETYNFKYDLVMRYRSNLFIDGDINLNINKNTLYNKCLYTDIIGLDDVFAYGDSNIINEYSNLYNNLPLILNKYKRLGPEEILYDWCMLEKQFILNHCNFEINLVR